MKRILNVLIIILLICLAAFLTLFSAEGTVLANKALRLCAFCVVPSLFPYMVVSSMLISTNAANYIGKILPLSRLSGLPDCASSSIILGALCGFPVGARSAVDLYKRRFLSKDEAEVLISYSNNTGPSFIVSVIGASFFKSRAFGWQLYISQLIASFIAATLINRLIFPFKKNTAKTEKIGLKFPDFFIAVKDSAISVITVCAFIVFFNVILGYIQPVLSSVSHKLTLLFCSLTEFTSASEVAAKEGGQLGRFLCGMSIGFSGLSVLCQTAAFTSTEELSLKRCICTKGIQGILTGLFALIPLKASEPESLTSIPLYLQSPDITISSQGTVIICMFLYLSLIKSSIKKYKIKKYLDL